MHKIWLPESIGEPLYLWAIDKQVSLYMMIALWALSSHTGASSPKVRLPMMPVAYGSRSTDPCKAPICNLHVLHVHLKPPSGVCILPAAQMNSGSPSNQRSRSYGTFYSHSPACSAPAHLIMALASSSALCPIFVLMPAANSVPCHDTADQAAVGAFADALCLAYLALCTHVSHIPLMKATL